MMLHSTYSDAELLKGLAEGNEKSFQAIYQRYWKRMYAMAYLRLQRTDTSEDIVQDIFTQLWEKRAQWQINHLESWLATAVKYKVITLVNRQLKKELSSFNTAETSYTDTTIDQRLLDQLLHTELNKLPEKCRLVFRLSRETSLSNHQIASELNISEKAVEKHITRARRTLSMSMRDLLSSFFSFLF